MKNIACLIFALMIFAGCNNYEKKTGIAEKEKKNISRELQEIIRLASLAPSSHNAQMWKVKIINEREILVLWDESRKLVSSDPENREALISIGAFIENFAEGAKKYSYDAEVTTFEDLGENHAVAKIVLHEKKFGNADEIIKNIEERHSVKTLFFKEKLREKDLDTLLEIDKTDIRYFHLDGKNGEYLKESVYQSFVKEALNTATQEELAEWIRVSDKEAKTTKDGMNAEMMGMEGMKKQLYYAVTTKNSAKSKFFISSGIKMAEKQAENCSGYLVLTSQSNTVPHLVNAGRTLERILLKANGLKVAVHPMSQMLHEEPWKSGISGKLELDRPVQMVLRVGYVENYGKPTSLRRDIWELIAD